MSETNDVCDNCGSDISPECISAKQDGHEDGYQDAFKVIKSFFTENGINSKNVFELDVDKARKLLYDIYYTVSY